MITLKWAKIPGEDVVGFKVYRSIIGFVANNNPAASGKTIQIKVGCDGPVQTIALVSDFVADINASLTGAKAFESLGGTSKFLVRADDREHGIIEIVGGTALSDLGLNPKVIFEKSDIQWLADVPVPSPDPDAVVTFEDPDGIAQDYYAITTVDSLGNESARTGLTRAETPVGLLCAINGTVIDLQGTPQPDAVVQATLIKMPTNTSARAYINDQTLETMTDADGNFSITVMQGATIRLQIPSIHYDQTILVPDKSFVVLSELMVSLNAQCPLEFTG